MWELDYKESWVLKNWYFWTVVFKRRLLRVPWTARRSNQSILKEISPGCSLEGLILKLKLQYFGHLMRRVDSLEKTLMPGGIGGRRSRGQQRMRWLDGIMARWTWVWMNSRSWWWTGRLGVLWFMGSQRVGHDWMTELTDWLNLLLILPIYWLLSLRMCMMVFEYLKNKDTASCLESSAPWAEKALCECWLNEWKEDWGW